MSKIKINIAYIFFCKYSKYMSDTKDIKSTNKQFAYSKILEKGLYVNEDDQDWGSAGMNDIQKDSSINQ